VRTLLLVSNDGLSLVEWYQPGLPQHVRVMPKFKCTPLILPEAGIPAMIEPRLFTLVRPCERTGKIAAIYEEKV